MLSILMSRYIRIIHIEFVILIKYQYSSIIEPNTKTSMLGEKYFPSFKALITMQGIHVGCLFNITNNLITILY